MVLAIKKTELSLVVIFACNDDQRLCVNAVNKSICINNSTRPKPSEIFSEGLRFSDPFNRFTKRILNQGIHSLLSFLVLALPVVVVFAG